MRNLPVNPALASGASLRRMRLVPGRVEGEVVDAEGVETPLLTVDPLGPAWLGLWLRMLHRAPYGPVPPPDDPEVIRLANEDGISPVPARHAVLARCTCGACSPADWCMHATVLAVAAAGAITVDPRELWVLRGLPTQPDEIRPAATGSPSPDADRAATPGTTHGAAPRAAANPAMPRATAAARMTVKAGGTALRARASGRPGAAPPSPPTLSPEAFWGSTPPPDAGRTEDAVPDPWTEEPRVLMRLGPFPTARGQADAVRDLLDLYARVRDASQAMRAGPRPKRARRSEPRKTVPPDGPAGAL